MKQIIKKPIVSEKSFSQAALGKFTFLVDPKYSKTEITSVLSDLYNVEIEKINSFNSEGKKKRTRGKIGKRDNYKKVIVTLKHGQKIDLFETESDEKAKNKDKKAEKKLK